MPNIIFFIKPNNFTRIYLDKATWVTFSLELWYVLSLCSHKFFYLKNSFLNYTASYLNFLLSRVFLKISYYAYVEFSLPIFYNYHFSLNHFYLLLNVKKLVFMFTFYFFHPCAGGSGLCSHLSRHHPTFYFF